MQAIVGIRTDHTARPSGDLSRHGSKLAPTIWFASSRQMAGVLSDENRALLRLIQDEQPHTMLALAALSGRAPSNLSRTLHLLERHGLVRLHRSAKGRAVRPEALATEFLVVLD